MFIHPVRKVIHRANIKNVGYFQSEKVGRPIAYESILECNVMYLLEFDKNVLSYCEQPVEIKYLYNGNLRRYYPDIGVERHNGIEILEVKPKDKLNDEKLKPKFDAARTYCYNMGYEYNILTEDDINSVKLENIKILFRYKHIIDEPNKIEKIIEIIERTDETDIYSLAYLSSNSKEETNDALAIIYSLLYNRILSFDISKPLNIYSKIWLPKVV